MRGTRIIGTDNRATTVGSVCVRSLVLDDARSIFVVDGAFSDDFVSRFYAKTRWMTYALCDVDGPETDFAVHWKHEFVDADKLLTMSPASNIVRMARELYPDWTVHPNRVHLNLHMYGDLQTNHEDSEPDEGITGLYYANARWEEVWMGETIFCDRSRDPLYAVAPRPGRVVLFPGDVTHRAGSPSRHCYEPRVSFAVKMRAERN